MNDTIITNIFAMKNMDRIATSHSADFEMRMMLDNRSIEELREEEKQLKEKIQEVAEKASRVIEEKDLWKNKAEENAESLASWKSKAEENFISRDSWKAKAKENLILLNQFQKQYDALSSSKLGKIQIFIWKLRGKKLPLKERIRGLAKKNSLLVTIVRQIRGQSTPPAKLNEPKIIAKNLPIHDFLPEIEKQLSLMPSSTNGRFYRASTQKVAIISDEFLYNTYKDIADTVSLHPDDWRGQIVNCDLLFIISGWRGIKEEWRGFSRSGSEKRKIILEIIECSKIASIPTVFYSIEDPPNYNQFVEIAKHCDYVFTTAAEVVEKYQKDCGHDRVYPLMFGINPLFHNPVGSNHCDKRAEVIFSGSWLDKYPERGTDICTIFDGVLASRYNLRVLDRNLALNDSQYSFPAKYSPYISLGIPHEILQKVHKLYDFAININSVKSSQTMFANRVYELEATGNLMISNYSAGVNSHLPLVYTSQDSGEVARILDTLTPLEIIERQTAGIRHAMTDNTCFDRYAEICKRVGLPVVSQQRVVGVVVKVITPNIISAFENQSYFQKELCLESELHSKYENFDIVAFWNNEKDYDIFYLEDMINAFKYTNCDYITKKSNCSHDFVNEVDSKYCSIFWRESYDAKQLLGMHDTNVHLPNGYCVDNLHYAEAILPKAISKIQNYKLSVVIPVYNNGLHLYGKAFASLLRSSIFEDMEILLIDDGSIDKTTKLYVKYIADRYENVRTFFFNDDGSGSASRPRNKGVEIAAAKYVTFLDPDNEAIGDGYAKLYELASENKYNLVVGNMVRHAETSRLANYYHYFKNVYGNDLLDGNKKDFLKKISFTPMSIQAMVIEKKLIIKNGLTQVVGSIGQDSLFSWQLFLNAQKVKALDSNIHIYYALRADSAVNTISKNFFHKNLLLEKAQFEWLKQEDLLEDYMNIRFNNFFRNWYLQKFSICKLEEKEDCAKIVSDIFSIYSDFYNRKDSVINAWLESKVS